MFTFLYAHIHWRNSSDPLHFLRAGLPSAAVLVITSRGQAGESSWIGLSESNNLGKHHGWTACPHINNLEWYPYLHQPPVFILRGENLSLVSMFSVNVVVQRQQTWLNWTAQSFYTFGVSLMCSAFILDSCSSRYIFWLLRSWTVLHSLLSSFKLLNLTQCSCHYFTPVWFPKCSMNRVLLPIQISV